jgi:hypothetical protein
LAKRRRFGSERTWDFDSVLEHLAQATFWKRLFLLYCKFVEMFMLEDPGRKRTKAERELEISRIRSHAAKRKNRKRREKKLSSDGVVSITTHLHKSCPRTQSALESTSQTHSITSDDLSKSPLDHRQLLLAPQQALAVVDGNAAERRSLYFFVECTAPEWSAWSDGHFWTAIVMQASTMHSCIRHSLIALAAGHEAMQSPGPGREKRFWWALQQGRQALSCLQEKYHTLSSAVLLMSHILILAFTTVLDESLMYKAMKTLYEFHSQLERQMIEAPDTVSDYDRFAIKEYLSPIIARQKVKLGSLVDILWSLQHSHASLFGSTDLDRIKIPKTFTSTGQARCLLDQLLNSIARTVKNLTPEEAFPDAAVQKMAAWMAAIGALQFSTLHQGGSEQTREICNIEILRLSAQVYFMLISVMHGVGNEMSFDQHTETYRAIARVTKYVLAYKKAHGHMFTTIGMESSLISFVGNAACRWCRDPVVRQELFDVLRQFTGREGFESAACWFDISNLMRNIEEAAVREPRVAEDIPEDARVRLVGADFYLRSNGRMAIRYLRYPYRTEDSRVAVLPYAGCGHFYTFDRFEEEPDGKPDVIFSRGYTYWLSHEASSQYYMVDHPEFHFNVTKV